MSDKIELLAPAGDFEKMKYAFAYGADAVYAGIPRFSLRARENKFNEKNIEEAVQYAHHLGKKIYLTLNIYPHNRKIDSFKKALLWMQKLEPDGIILSDPGIILLAKEICPKISIHLSTQANTVNYESVKFWRNQGISRIILSRELSINEISEIRNEVPKIELEAFVHGAICIAYSGRCLLSNYFNYRDPNQGTCTNSCRWQYRLFEEQKTDGNEYTGIAGDFYLEQLDRPGEMLPIDEDEHGTYIMNSKDLCAIRLISKLKDSGINCFKIEGRTKSIYYLCVVTRVYRKAIDDLNIGKPFDTNLEKEVNAVANRGYTTGFYERNPLHTGENLGQSHSNDHTHIFCGIIQKNEKEDEYTKIVVRNRFDKGDLLEIISPQKTIQFRADEIMSTEGEQLEVAHGGGKDIFLKIPGKVEDFSLLRKPV